MTLGIIIGLLIGLALAFTLAPLFSRDKKEPKKNGAALKKTYAVLAVFVVGLSLGLYYFVGRPELVNPPVLPDNFGGDLFAEQKADQLPSIDIMVEQLKARLDQDPDDVEGWGLLGQSLMILGRFEEAIGAYQKAITIAPAIADLHSALGEAMTLKADGVISEAAMRSFQNALELDPNEPISRFYLGDYAFQAGDFQLAYDRWLAVYNDIPAETPWLSLLEQRLQEAAKRLGLEPPETKVASAPEGPSADEISQMSQEDQRAMIEGMVATLAARLEKNPDDLDGWTRLGRSYMVLGRYQDGAAAYQKVAEALPDQVTAQEQYAQALLTWQQSQGQPVGDDAFQVLTRLLDLDGNNPTALFYLGQAAAERGESEAARAYWQKLLTLMGPDSPDSAMVQEKLDSLK